MLYKHTWIVKSRNEIIFNRAIGLSYEISLHHILSFVNSRNEIIFHEVERQLATQTVSKLYRICQGVYSTTLKSSLSVILSLDMTSIIDYMVCYKPGYVDAYKLVKYYPFVKCRKETVFIFLSHHFWCWQESSLLLSLREPLMRVWVVDERCMSINVVWPMCWVVSSEY